MQQLSSCQLDAYCRRINYAGELVPSLDVLQALTLAQATHIPFENIDVLQRKPLDITPQGLFIKLVAGGRGGYCFELNGLFLAVLQAIGFAVRPLRAGVRLGRPNREDPVGHTHLCLAVELAGQTWITDVGVGSHSLTRALKLQANVEQQTPHDWRRFVQDNGRWYLQMLHGDNWIDAYEFAGEAMEYPDRKVANWYTSTHADSHFGQQLTVAMAQPDGERISLANQTFSRRFLNGKAQKITCKTPAKLQQVLAEYFELDVALDIVASWPFMNPPKSS